MASQDGSIDEGKTNLADARIEPRLEVSTVGDLTARHSWQSPVIEAGTITLQTGTLISSGSTITPIASGGSDSVVLPSGPNLPLPTVGAMTFDGSKFVFTQVETMSPENAHIGSVEPGLAIVVGNGSILGSISGSVTKNPSHINFNEEE